MATRTAFRTCPLCEACCGLEVTVTSDEHGPERVTRIRGDRDDVFSHGFVCPKGTTLGKLHDDPDRLRRPLVTRDGRHVEVDWDEAWQAVAEGLSGVQRRHGSGAVAVYVGNPNAHNIGAMTFNAPLIRSLRTKHVYSASTADQRPKEVSAGLMFGSFSVPVPDVDRTDYVLCLGANPLESNGSFATAADWPGRIRRLVERGGSFVTVDPRRTKTAETGTEWVPIRPGTDAHLLAALIHVLVADDLVDLGVAEGYVNGLDEVASAVHAFSPEAVETITTIPAATISRLAHELAGAERAAVYGRMGTTTARFGTINSWLIDVLNVLTGNLDRPGGAMFAKAATGSPNTRGTPGVGRGIRIGTRKSRIRELPETFGELPVAVLAEEITTPGDDQIRGFVCVAGNPVLSTPNSDQLDDALGDLEFMVAVDIYLNETTRHADVILPVPSALQKPHYDLALLQLALHNVANWSEPVLALDDGQPDEWEVLAKLALIAGGAGADADPADVDDQVYSKFSEHLSAADADDIEASGRRGPARLVDAMLRTGPYDLTLDDLLANPHGIDLGPLESRFPDILRTPSGRIELAPPELLADWPRLAATLDPPTGDGDVDDGEPARPFSLIGRRHLRSNNSWMHNVEVLVKGRPRCTVQIHPRDADALGVTDGAPVEVASRVGSVVAPAEITDAIAPGVVSIPHGWGHGVAGTSMRVAAEYAGVNANVLTDERDVEAVTGTAVFNGVPVAVRPA